MTGSRRGAESRRLARRAGPMGREVRCLTAGRLGRRETSGASGRRAVVPARVVRSRNTSVQVYDSMRKDHLYDGPPRTASGRGRWPRRTPRQSTSARGSACSTRCSSPLRTGLLT
jgi:hypothetical protein